MANLYNLNLHLEPGEIALLCEALGVRRTESITETNAAIKEALGVLSGFQPQTTADRKKRKRKQERLAKARADLADAEAAEEAKLKAPRRSLAEIQAQAKANQGAGAPAQVSPAGAPAPGRAPRATAPQPIAHRGGIRPSTDEPEALPDIYEESLAEYRPDFLADDDEDDIDEIAELWEEAMEFMAELKRSGNELKLARATAKAKQLRLTPDTISRENLRALRASIGGAA